MDDFRYHKIEKNSFEGWYYKLSFNDEIISIIPGISKNEEDPHAFIQYIDKEKNEYIRFDIKDFEYDEKRERIVIKENSFSKDRLILNLDDINIFLNISKQIPWGKNLFTKSAMGPFSFFKMQCNHGIINMGSNFTGTKNMEMINGKIYIEKDWGESFPSSWIWFQSNFKYDKNRSLTFSYANVPFFKKAFKGLLAAVYYEDKLIKFTTYNFSKIKSIKYDKNNLKIEIHNKKYKLMLDIKIGSFKLLKSPKNGKMSQEIKESIDSELNAYLYDKDNNLIFEDSGKTALEIYNYEELI
ncbi:hypothetical protein OF820_03140 [Oceanotoga sp. DSM 15011]|jgi:hypothetical protein|uniref:tocopherol cyclase family protein n=1 Tax=Oceanotoga sp. DSM 15011 TaxID=2984951 RepID=UPI0021F3DCDE|nr:tocopherol cyclase family protein [Oceanotoga sp. DSM 15011]UYP00686.1 hypothetical protein OF820_03140 [Oceanotoga sp. DSM 15011]